MDVKISNISFAEEVNNYENIIVYGARYRGGVLVRYLKKHFPGAKVFVAVSNKGHEALYCAGLIVERLDSYIGMSESAAVLIATQLRYHEEMEDTARALGFSSVIHVDDEFFNENSNRPSLAKKLAPNNTYALSTNDRGLHVIEFLETKGINFDNINVLDIGCGYGGFSIEAKRRGANMVHGVDIGEAYIDYSLANLEDETDEIREGCKFEVCDITDEKALLILPKNYFNLILLVDVFEHVYDTCKLMEHLNIFAASGCSIYFEIPNGLHHFDYIERDPHCQITGISWLLPQLWYEKTGNIWTYYRRWDYYVGLFAHYGFTDIQLFDLHARLNVSKEDLIVELNEKLQHLEDVLYKKISDEAPSYIEAVNNALQNFKCELKRDIDDLEVNQLVFKYLSPFWQGIIKKP